ncbi:hypothetical protein A2U01_0056941, partial [Trifolium medium]|nr:hypothetical protein [Trifolium medium]
MVINRKQRRRTKNALISVGVENADAVTRNHRKRTNPTLIHAGIKDEE